MKEFLHALSGCLSIIVFISLLVLIAATASILIISWLFNLAVHLF